MKKSRRRSKKRRNCRNKAKTVVGEEEVLEGRTD